MTFELKLSSFFRNQLEVFEPNTKMAKMNEGFPKHLLYKNHLQEYAQKSGLQLPVYQTSSEGFSHAPRFRASVRVDQTTYTSELTFPHKKDAEQNIAKVALDAIKQTLTKDHKPRFSTIYEDPKRCKSILIEFAIRTNRRIPKYRTVQQNKLQPVYISSLDFDGKTYTGEVSGSKKEAEQLVARVAIESLLESDSGILLQIINSKNETCDTVNKVNDYGINQSNPRRPGPSQEHVNVMLPSIVNINSVDSSANQKNKRKSEPSPVNLHSIGPSANANQKNKQKLEPSLVNLHPIGLSTDANQKNKWRSEVENSKNLQFLQSCQQ